MNINDPILQSMLDDDLYKINMGSVVFHLFPRAIVTYEFINRGKTQFPIGFGDALREQIKAMESLQLTKEEASWLKTIPYVRPTYIEWLSGYRMDSNEVFVSQVNGELAIKITGPWYRTIFWEVKLMAVISELYFKMMGRTPDDYWIDRIDGKGLKLQDSGCYWIDFGTRRRFSFETQDTLVRKMTWFRGFLGTSNPYLAFKYKLTPHGTYAHESIMAMSALYGDFYIANKMWMKHWSEHFDGNVGVALTDTFTTNNFIHTFGSYEARLFDGVRHDSNDPFAWGEKMLAHYRALNIPTSNKRLVFSDSLNTEKYIAIDRHFRQWAQPVGGIGTNFTNDVGCLPLNMVIKLTSADFGFGPIEVIKLSDDVSKATGNPELVREAKKKLNIL